MFGRQCLGYSDDLDPSVNWDRSNKEEEDGYSHGKSNGDDQDCCGMSDSDLDPEELEVALYSQIYFEPNPSPNQVGEAADVYVEEKAPKEKPHPSVTFQPEVSTKSPALALHNQHDDDIVHREKPSRRRKLKCNPMPIISPASKKKLKKKGFTDRSAPSQEVMFIVDSKIKPTALVKFLTKQGSTPGKNKNKSNEKVIIENLEGLSDASTVEILDSSIVEISDEEGSTKTPKAFSPNNVEILDKSDKGFSKTWSERKQVRKVNKNVKCSTPSVSDKLPCHHGYDLPSPLPASECSGAGELSQKLEDKNHFESQNWHPGTVEENEDSSDVIEISSQDDHNESIIVLDGDSFFDAEFSKPKPIQKIALEEHDKTGESDCEYLSDTDSSDDPDRKDEGACSSDDHADEGACSSDDHADEGACSSDDHADEGACSSDDHADEGACSSDDHADEGACSSDDHADEGACSSDDHADSDSWKSAFSEEDTPDLNIHIQNSTPRFVLDCDELDDLKDVTLDDVHNSLGECDWSVVPQDTANASRSFSFKMRYYTPFDVTCKNCDTKGHLSKLCPHPKKSKPCLFCGLDGHLHQSCPNEVCFACELVDHPTKRCTVSWRKKNAECFRCSATGHEHRVCPDVWRQYHLTTEDGPLVRPEMTQKENRAGYCYNCGHKGHFGHECNKRRMGRKTPKSPFIYKYNNHQEDKIDRIEKHKVKGEKNNQKKRKNEGSEDCGPRRKKTKVEHMGKDEEDNRGAQGDISNHCLNSYAAGIIDQKITKGSRWRNKKKRRDKLSAAMIGDFPRGGKSIRPKGEYENEAGPSNEWWKDGSWDRKGKGNKKKKKPVTNSGENYNRTDISRKKKKKRKKKNNGDKRSVPEKNSDKFNNPDGLATAEGRRHGFSHGRRRNIHSNWKNFGEYGKSQIYEAQRVYNTRSRAMWNSESSFNHRQRGKGNWSSSSRQSGGNHLFISERGFKASRSKTSY